METTVLDSQDPSKRKWTPAEDIKLVEALVEYHHEREGSPENKFKPGYLKILEGKISTKLPNAGLRAKPHIESRLRTLKREFQVIHEMLTGPNTSGFGWDTVRKCVTAENDVWDAYVQSHKGAIACRNKSFPHYEDLCIVYAKDHATGKDAQAPADVVEELEAEKNDDKLDDIPEDVDCTQIPTPGSNGEEQNARKKKRKIQSGEDNMVEAMKEVTIILAAQLKDASDNLSKAVIGVVAVESRSKINDELLKLPGLTTKERHKATKLIACQHELIDVFLSMLDAEKEEWVKGLINGDF
ncbi:uncharacterized protein At2g29880-like [Quercus lobata]|uniref:uncharacterized protein At2g29880-like n=1 Tax=Quercus lobata TaxID=97700 RepID=UPI0012462FD5|nr:uncharacterized protein At2g29880-like [Quercus lobata]XP_030941093.1 uncharacterized protein At2g29880-like [Quercus lobata]XP_030941094.1 uncharacterized protein At2g29880-like [Quercus lobata]